MKYVCKGREPDAFREWKALASATWQPRWADLRSPEKPELHRGLISEQGALCCYCGRRISTEDSHIEHFRPRAVYPHRALDYDNLLASCQRDVKPKVPRVCGRAKEDWFDEAYHVDPQDPQCERRFRFGSRGAIAASQSTDHAASTMVTTLNLNAPFLTALRMEVLEGAFPSEVLAAEDDAGLIAIARSYGESDQQGWLPEMGHVVQRWARDTLGIPP